MQAVRKSKAPTSITVAMETLAAAQGVGLHETSADIIRGRALKHYSDGIKQYLALRLRDLNSVSVLMGALRKEVLAWPATQLLEPPSPRALLYRAARRLFVAYSNPSTISGSRTILPWRPLDADAPQSYVNAISEIRTHFADDAAELLELRFARELSLEEVAFTLEEPVEAVRSRIDDAEDEARAILGDAPPSRMRGLAGAIVEAFALRLEALTDLEEEDEHVALPQGMLLGNRFEVETRVGVGAFSDVYRAHDMHVPGHIVALKLLHQPSLSEAAKEAALRELHLIASVFHPSVVHFKDHGWHEQRLWFVMPWYEGEPLEARMQHKALTPAQARRIFEPLANALATLHAAGIRHQDIKPDNIFLARIRSFGLSPDAGDILPVLIDLGVAAREAEVLVAGTPMYFAPEVAARFASIPDSPAITNKADVFALALSLRNALEPQSQEDVPAAAVDAFIEHRARQAPALPRSKHLRYLEPSFKRWMAVNPADRPTADEFSQELAELTAPDDRRARRKALIKQFGPLLLAVLLGFASVVYGLWREREVQKLETARAKLEAEDVRAVLNLESARRKALEQGREDLMRQYTTSTLSRQDLASKLATSEQDLKFMTQGITLTRKRMKKIEDTLEQTSAQLQETSIQLAREKERGSELTSSLNDSRGEANRLNQELTSLRSEAERLRAEIGELRVKAESEHTRANDLTQELNQSRTTRARLEQDVADMRAQVAALEREVDTLRRRANTPAAP